MHDFSGVNNPRYKTGLTMDGGSSLYRTWQNMKARCLRPTHPKFPRYGGRGIKICDEWLDIIGFQKWALESGWEEGLSIDRIDNNGNYEPSNCQWVSMSENSRKKSTTRLLEDDVRAIREMVKEGLSDAEIANLFNVSAGSIWFIRKGRTHTHVI